MEKQAHANNAVPPAPGTKYIWFAAAFSLAWCLLGAGYLYDLFMLSDRRPERSEVLFVLIAILAPLMLIWSAAFVTMGLREMNINARLLSEAAWRLNHPDQAFVDATRSVSAETRRQVASLEQALRDMAASLEQVRTAIVTGNQDLQKSLEQAGRESATLSQSLSREWQGLSGMLDSLGEQSESLRANSEEIGLSLREAALDLTRVMERSLAQLSAHLEDSREQIGILIRSRAEEEASLGRQAGASLVHLEEQAHLAVSILEEAGQSTARRLEQILATLPETLAHARTLLHEIDDKTRSWRESERQIPAP